MKCFGCNRSSTFVVTLVLFCRECHENNGLYHALQLETMFNINSFLNRTVVCFYADYHVVFLPLLGSLCYYYCHYWYCICFMLPVPET